MILGSIKFKDSTPTTSYDGLRVHTARDVRLGNIIFPDEGGLIEVCVSHTHEHAVIPLASVGSITGTWYWVCGDQLPSRHK